MLKNSIILLPTLVVSSFVTLPIAGIAQVIPDNTLPGKTNVSISGNEFIINGGTLRGSNLFHSFSKLNVANGSNAKFNNATAIQNIISRVTDGQISRIEGTLSANGPANLFLLNTSGFIFGPNSKLNLGGSLFVTTANRLEFIDGGLFDSDGQNSSLSSTFPSSFIFEGNSAPITFEGDGGQLRFFAPLLGSPFEGAGQSPNGLTASQGQGLYVFGGKINLDGGVLTAPSGTINLSSINSGKVNLSLSSKGYNFDYSQVSSFDNVSLGNNSLVDASGIGNGKIDIYAKNIDISNSSKILVASFGDTSTSDIKIKATEDINISGILELRFFLNNPFNIRPAQAGIFTQHFGPSKGPGIQIQSNNLFVNRYGYISASTYGVGPGGDTVINVQNLLSIDGELVLPSTFSNSVINTFSTNGAAGNISLRGKQLKVLNGAFVVSQTTSSQAGGSLKIDFSESIDLVGSSLADARTNSFLPSTLTSGTTAGGRSGDISIFTKRLNITGGANINALTAAQGNGGEIRINATESLIISGEAPNSPDDLTLNISGIFSTGSNINPLFISFFGPEALTGDAGRISINTGELVLDSNAQIGVLNQGSGNAGTIDVNASKISILNGASISAETFSGKGGEIAISSRLLDLRQGNISASARQDGPGGNVTINSDLVVAIDGSNISGNAQNARGGNIRINTVGFILSPDSQVTATSQRGEQFDGNVDIDAEITDFSQDPDLNVQVDPPELYSACSDTYRDTLAYYHVGIAGRPTSSITRTPADGGWLKAAKARYDQRRLTYIDPQTGERKPLKRVVGWKTNANGTITFVNNPVEADQYAPAMAARQKACQQDQAKAS